MKITDLSILCGEWEVGNLDKSAVYQILILPTVYIYIYIYIM